MASKVLLSLNAAAVLGAYLLYANGVRLVLEDDEYDYYNDLGGMSAQTNQNAPIHVVSSSSTPSAPASSWGGSGQRDNYTCTNARMQPKFLSYDPVMVYIENFMSPFETDYLKQLAQEQYEPSVVENFDNGASAAKNSYVDPSTRKSETAWLSDADPVVACVKARAAEFQGFAPQQTMEELAVLKYQEGGAFTTHYDWHAAAPQAVDRRTSFFATLAASDGLEGGATWFPLVARPAWGRDGMSHNRHPWCRGGWLDCAYETGVAVRPVPGNAVFWVNFREDGTGHEGTAHGGEPVVKGTKIGLNIWTKARVRVE